jgi:subfamily B ATP-binding cassette protein MsbA
MSKEIQKQSYMRLLRYAKPYRAKLAIGVISGFIVGGSLFGSFFWLKDFIKPFEVSPDGKISIEADLSGANAVSKPAPAAPSADANVKQSKEIDELEKFAGKLGLPVKDEQGRMTWQFFLLAISGFIALWLVRSFAAYLNKYYTRWVGTRVVADLRNEIFSKLMGQSLKYYGNMDVGQLISRCTNDTAAIESAIAYTIADATRCPMEIIACAGFIIYTSVINQNFVLPLILFIGLPAAVLPIIMLGRKIRKSYRKAFAKIAEIVSRMHEVFTGILVVKAYHMEKDENDRFQSVNRVYFKTVVKALKFELMMQPLMEFVAVLCSIIFLVFCYAKGVKLSEIVVLIVPAVMAYQPLKNLAKINTYIQRSMAAADRYFELIDTHTEICEKPSAVELKEFKSRIEFKNVVFSYDERRILDDLNLVIPFGKVVAVVGETGSGKTTIANLIARFYDVNSGSVSIDGHDVRDLKISSIRDIIGIVSQNTILFNDTIANNISYGCRNASKDEIIEAAKKANAYQFIVDGRHPEGFDTVVGEKGFKLSGGEKQRISIARAILKNPPILILDEATSALDTVTEKLVQDALNNLMSHRTVFAIAHRLSTIKHAGLIIVLLSGKIIESGTHDELIARNGQYKRLCDMQFGMHSPKDGTVE